MSAGQWAAPVTRGPASRAAAPVLAVLVCLAGALPGAARASAQVAPDSPPRSLEATPIGALPPMPLPMPASRNHNYWHVRAQTGIRTGRDGGDLFAAAVGVDLQWRGGSVFGLTGGYQWRDCAADAPECDGHAFVGAGARLNFLTGGPTLAALIGDHTATSTLGTELGFGYAPDVAPGRNACTADLGVPVTISMFRRTRVAVFATPSMAVEFDCSPGGHATKVGVLASGGVAVQQLGHPGLDVSLGLQKIFRGGTGYQIGISVVYVHLP